MIIGYLDPWGNVDPWKKSKNLSFRGNIEDPILRPLKKGRL